MRLCFLGSQTLRLHKISSAFLVPVLPGAFLSSWLCGVAELCSVLTVEVNPLLGQIQYFIFCLNSCSRFATDSLLGEYFRIGYTGLKFLSFPCG